MFDIGFPELVLISIVALVVIGPERLPQTVRTIMLWLGRIRRSFMNIKMELEQEIGADEIRQQLHNESIMKDLKETKQTIQDAIAETDHSISDLKKSVDESINLEQNTSTPTSSQSTKPLEDSATNNTDREQSKS